MEKFICGKDSREISGASCSDFQEAYQTALLAAGDSVRIQSVRFWAGIEGSQLAFKAFLEIKSADETEN